MKLSYVHEFLHLFPLHPVLQLALLLCVETAQVVSIFAERKGRIELTRPS